MLYEMGGTGRVRACTYFSSASTDTDFHSSITEYLYPPKILLPGLVMIVRRT